MAICIIDVYMGMYYNTWELIIKLMERAQEKRNFNNISGSLVGQFTTSLRRSATSCLGRNVEIHGTPSFA